MKIKKLNQKLNLINRKISISKTKIRLARNRKVFSCGKLLILGGIQIYVDISTLTNADIYRIGSYLHKSKLNNFASNIIVGAIFNTTIELKNQKNTIKEIQELTINNKYSYSDNAIIKLINNAYKFIAINPINKNIAKTIGKDIFEKQHENKLLKLQKLKE